MNYDCETLFTLHVFVTRSNTAFYFTVLRICDSGVAVRDPYGPDILLVPQTPDLYRRAHNVLLTEIGAAILVDAVKSIDELMSRMDPAQSADPCGLARLCRRASVTLKDDPGQRRPIRQLRGWNSWCVRWWHSDCIGGLDDGRLVLKAVSNFRVSIGGRERQPVLPFSILECCKSVGLSLPAPPNHLNSRAL